MTKRTVKEATHFLKCSTAGGKIYYKKCVFLKTMDTGKIKVLTFGYRDEKNTEHFLVIHYVNQDRLRQIKRRNK